MNEQIFMNDIVASHSARIQHIGKYYPIFKLWDGGLNLYKDGQYAFLDMAYLTLAVIRYFIEENSFNDRPVTYEMYASLMKTLLVRDFALDIPDSEMQPLVSFIFDKLCNDGKPFTAQWFDPADKKVKTLRTRLIESRFMDGRIVYSLTSDAIEFYLDTKEIKDESQISVDQVLLEKMVKSKNFIGGLAVISRINQEVTRLISQKDEIVALLGRNVFEGTKALEAFLENGLRWFDEEQKLFQKNKALVDQAMRMNTGQAAAKEIYAVDMELKRAMKKHGDLLEACTQLQVQADEMISRARKTRFRRSVDFVRLKEAFLEADTMTGLETMITPILGLNLKKTLNFSQLDGLLEYKPEEKMMGEAIEKGRERMYVYEDDAAAARISHNFEFLLKVLFDQMLEKGRTDLKYLCHLYMMKFGEEIYTNGDFFAFLTHLSQKDSYDLKHIKEKQDTFLEGIIADYLENGGDRYDHLKFSLQFEPDEKISPTGLFEVTNIIFERK